jgi:DNA-binding MarR family transcriptional regulator
MTMPSLDEIIHQPVRLRLMAALVALKSEESAEFTLLRDLLGVTDGNLGAHLHRLEEAGYIEITKTFVDRKPRTYVAATAQGRKVFRNQVAALEEILKGAVGAKTRR